MFLALSMTLVGYSLGWSSVDGTSTWSEIQTESGARAFKKIQERTSGVTVNSRLLFPAGGSRKRHLESSCNVT